MYLLVIYSKEIHFMRVNGMSKIAVTYSPIVGGSSVISLKESFLEVEAKVVDADYRQMMADIPEDEFINLYASAKGRQRLFAHAKTKASELLNKVDCLALSGNSAMIDPELFNKSRQEGQNYDFSRTIVELALVHVATEKGMPIFGVCGGHQVIAVYGGGEIADLNADKLNKQRFMNYDTIKINKNTILYHIIFGKELPQEVTITHDECEFFGAHNQVVAKLGKGFKQTAVASDYRSIEATENEFGVPILTTQFHPEVGAQGLPSAKFIYQRTQTEVDTNLKFFDYVNKAGDAYHQKKLVMDELKSLKPKDNSCFISPSTQKKPTKDRITSRSKKSISPFHLKRAPTIVFVIGSIITVCLFIAFPPTAILGAVGILGAVAIAALAVSASFAVSFGLRQIACAIKNRLSNFIRCKVSDYLTHQRLVDLREKEETAETLGAPSDNVKADNTYSVILTTITSPGELLRDTPMVLWEKQTNDISIDDAENEKLALSRTSDHLYMQLSSEPHNNCAMMFV